MTPIFIELKNMKEGKNNEKRISKIYYNYAIYVHSFRDINISYWIIEIEEDEIAIEHISDEETAGTEPCRHALMPYISDDESMILNNV